MKKIISIIVCFLMLTSAFGIYSSAFVTAPTEGSFGDGFSYKFDTKTAELIITGNGDMPDFKDAGDRPWNELATAITSVKLSDGITSIGDNAFYKCKFKEISLPNGIKSIGEYAFAYNRSLKSITIPNGVTVIKPRVFDECTALESVVLPDTVTAIGDSAFGSCWELESIDIPSSVTTIGSLAFYQCYKLVSVTLPDGMQSLSSSAFYGCKKLQSISIPASVTLIEHNLLNECRSFKYIHFRGSEAEWKNVKVELNNDVLLAATVICNTCLEHDFDNGTVTVEPAHGVDGEKVYKCSKCDAKIEEKLDMTEPHRWKNPKITTEPTHTEYGVETYYCDCGATNSYPLAKLKEHEWNDSRVKKEPTESEEGIIVYYCPCGERKSENIPKLSANTTAEVTTEQATTANASSGGCQGRADIYLALLIPLTAGVVFFKSKRRTNAKG